MVLEIAIIRQGCQDQIVFVLIEGQIHHLFGGVLEGIVRVALQEKARISSQVHLHHIVDSQREDVVIRNFECSVRIGCEDGVAVEEVRQTGLIEYG